MILLLGGVGGTAQIATAIAAQGYRVLVSKATSVPLDVGQHANIEGRCGPLDETGLLDLLAERKVRAIVDATHPYATTIRALASRVANQVGVPYLTFVRPAAIDASEPGVEFAADHAAAARAAFVYGRPVLLTTGTRNLSPYAAESQRTGVTLVVRVLENPESREACRQAGIADDRIIAGRGPFSVEDNRRHIRLFGVGVLVTKDSGQQGGTLEKLQAAREENCRVVVVQRPELGSRGEPGHAASPEQAFTDVGELLRALRERVR